MPILSSNIRPRRGLTISRADGALFWDSQDRPYIDLCSQTMNMLFGQRHPRIYNEAFNALQRFTFVDQDFASADYDRALNALSALVPSHLSVFNLRMNDGSSAVECAVKQARRRTGKSRVLTVDGIYLGQNAQTIHFRGWGKRPEDILIGGREDVIFAPIPFPNFDIPFEHSPAENGKSIADLIERHKEHLACVLLDPIMISSGVTTGRGMSQLLRRADEACKEFGIPLILDECQTFGWVPDHTITAHYKIETDLLVLGKGLGGGFPLSACLSRPEFDNLEFGDADYTNGGSIAAIAGLVATCELLSSAYEQDHFSEISQYLKSALASFGSQYAGRIWTRGIGLIHAIEIRIHKDPALNIALARVVADEILRQGVYVRTHMNCLTLKPPRVISLEQLSLALQKVFDVVGRFLKES